MFLYVVSGNVRISGQDVTQHNLVELDLAGGELTIEAVSDARFVFGHGEPINEPVVWIKTGAERYTPQPVQVKPLDAKTVLVIRGLAADNRVVVQGAPLIAQIR